MGWWHDRRIAKARRIIEGNINEASKLNEKYNLQMMGNVIGPKEVYDSFEVSSVEFQKVIDLARKVSDGRKEVVETYNEMLKDGTIQSALELVTDDATQKDNNGYRVNIVTENNESLKIRLRAFLRQVVRIEEKLYPLVYNMLAYGESFLRTNFTYQMEQSQAKSPDELSDGKRNKLTVSLRDFEVWDKPGHLVEIVERGTTMGYLELDDDWKPKYMHPSEEFIHFISDRTSATTSIDIVTREMKTVFDAEGNKSEQEVETKRTVKARVGTSYLAPAVRDWQTLNLVENTVLSARLSRSAFYRIFQVDVKNADPKETKRILSEIDHSINKRETFNRDRYSAENVPLAIASNLVLPNREGKGVVTFQNVGGDIDVKDLADLDYFSNKLFGDLRIPAEYLGGSNGDVGIQVGDSSLARRDARYGRTVLRVSDDAALAITRLCELWLRLQGKFNTRSQFRVQMARIITAEDIDNRADIQARADLVASILQLVETLDPDKKVYDREKLAQRLAQEVLRYDFLEDCKNSDVPVQNEDADDEESAGDEDTPVPEGGSDFTPSSPPPESEMEEPTEPDTSDQSGGDAIGDEE